MSHLELARGTTPPAAAAPDRAESAEHAVELLLRSIHRGIDAAKVVNMTAVSGWTDVCALLVLDDGRTYERRIVAGEWHWVAANPVPEAKLAVLERMTGGRKIPAALEGTLATRYEFNRRFHGALRHVLQAFGREEFARAELEFTTEAEKQYVRPMGVPIESEAMQRKLEAAGTVTDAAIAALADELLDEILTLGTGVAGE